MVSPAPTLYPAGRYGRRRDPAWQRRRRWLTVALGIVVVLAGVGIAVKLYRQYSLAPYQVRIISVTDLTDTAVTVTFEVTKPAGQGASCTVLGHTRDGLEVGHAEITVPPGNPHDPTARVTYTLTTSQRAVTGEVPGCGPLRP